MIRRGILSAAAAAVVILGACTADAGELEAVEPPTGVDEDVAPAEDTTENPQPEVEAEPAEDGSASAEATQPAEDIDITTVPDEITVEYVQAVVDELERIYAEALVILMEEGELTIEVTDRIGEIFAVRQLDLRTREFVDLAEENFPGLRPAEDIEVRRRIVQRIIESEPHCVYVETLTSDDAFLNESAEPVAVFLILELPTVERPVDVNPTPWVYGALGVGEREAMETVRPCSD